MGAGRVTGPAVPAPKVDRYRVPLVTLSVAQLMLLLDATIVNVALPSIQQSLHMTGSELEWVVTGYSLPFGGLLLLGGRAGDIVGRRRVFFGGLVLFTSASLLGGLATTSWWLLACRAAQGMGAAAAYPATLSLIAATFPDGPARHRAVATLSAVGGSGGAIGLLAGGVISTYLSWRWIMFVNVPLGVFILTAAPRALPETQRHSDRFDLAGALAATLGLTLAVYGLTRGATDQAGRSHWLDPAVVVSLAAAVLLLVVFILVERRTTHPLVPLRIFADWSRSGTYVVAILLSSAMFGIFFFMTIFIERVWGYSPLLTSIVYVPLAILLVAGAWAGGRMVGPIGARRLSVIGLGVAVIGMAWLSRIGSSGGYTTGMLVPSLLTYAGIGLTTVPQTLVAVAGVPSTQAGLASGLFYSARQVGGAIGLAVIGTLTWSEVAATARADAAASGAGHTPATLLTNHAISVGVEWGFAFAAALTAAGVLVAAATCPVRAPAKSTATGAEGPARSPSVGTTGADAAG